ncbi:MAG: hypothetical protein WC972_11305 [Trueperaceae bacterium]|jgi:hypothetical protein|nr:hypothetical protein [Truepera sp.]
MLERFTDYAIAFLGLLEAEGRAARKGLVAAATKLALSAGGALLLTLAFALFGWALYLALAPVWGQAWATVACGALLLILGGGLLWFANRKSSRK